MSPPGLKAWFLLVAGILVVGSERVNLHFPFREAAPKTEKPLMPIPKAVSAPSSFGDWMREYSIAPIAELEAAGIELARERRKEMRRWMETDPERAWENRISWRERQGLPAAVQAELETLVSGTGDLEVRAATPAPGQTNDFRPVIRTAIVAGREYEAFVYGRRVNQPTRIGVSLHGVALDSVMALSDSPVRLLEPGEPATPSKTFAAAACPVSGSDAAAAWAESGSQVYQLCSAEHVSALAEAVWQQEVQATSSTAGAQSALVVLVDFPDLPGGSTTPANALQAMQQVDLFYRSNSFQALSIEPVDATPVMRLPQDSRFYFLQGHRRLMSDAILQAQTLGYDVSSYRFTIFSFVNIGYPWGGLGTISGNESFIQGSSFWTDGVEHELGHNLGVWHAGGWLTDNESVIGPGQHVEYGNAFDVMGSGAGHLNGAFKSTLGWLQESNITTANLDGTYRIYALDIGGELASDKAYTLRVPATPALYGLPSDYWVDYRQRFADQGTSSGALIHWSTNSVGIENSHLLDMNPGGINGFRDAALRVGRTFVDNVRRICITPIAKGPNWLDIAVKLQPLNSSSPSVTLDASTLSAKTGQPIQFTATANDADGDRLAYYWDFDDGTVMESSLNQPSATKSWPSAREYSVRCVVSDMKGGEASASVLVRVGNPTTYHVAGTVMSMPGVRVHNGLFGPDYRATFTDSAGRFVLAGLPAGSYLIGAARAGNSFKPMFDNPVPVGPTDVDGLQFEPRPAGSMWVTGFSPLSAVVGTPVVIDGASFSTITSVKFAGRSGTFTIESPERIRTWVPSGAVSGPITVSGSAGTASSSAAFTVIPSVPVITRHPQGQSNQYTFSASFSAAAQGSGPLSYQWRKDGVAIPGATSTNYSITNLQPEHAGIYDWVASNPVGAVTSNPARLMLGGPPHIIDQPQSTNVVWGEPAVFSVRALGTAPLYYQWYRGSVGQPIAGAKEQSYVIAAAQTTDANYSYFVIVSNSFSWERSGPAFLSFMAPPFVEIVAPREGAEVPTGRMEVLARAYGQFPVERVELFDDTNRLAETVQREGDNFYRLIFTNDIPGQRLSLAARVTDNHGHSALSTEDDGVVQILVCVPLSVPEAEWEYLDDGADPGRGWQMFSSGDQPWKLGTGYFGFGNRWDDVDGPRTFVDFGGAETNKYVTTYFRRRFAAPNPAELSNIVLRVTHTGGMIAYLNDHEILRTGMPTGAVDYLTLAPPEEWQTKDVQKRLDPGLFVGGENKLAVEVHVALRDQESTLFNLRLLADLPPGPPEISIVYPQLEVVYPQLWGPVTEPQFEMRVDAFDVDGDVTNVTFFVDWRQFGVLATPPHSIVISNLPPLGYGSPSRRVDLSAFAIDTSGEYGFSGPIYIVPPSRPGYVNIIGERSPWAYDNLGLDSGTTWREFPFQAQMPNWEYGSAPFVFMNHSSAITRFRNVFDLWVQQGAGGYSRVYTNVALYLLTELSDGAIVYLNGTEVFRYNLPPGPITNDTYTGLPPTVFGYVRADIDPSLLQSRNNLVAVEMHQNQPNSENFVFDFALVGTIEPSFPELRVARKGSRLALEWDSTYWYSVGVEQAASPDGLWYPLYEPPDDVTIYPGIQKFFRLRWKPY